MRRKLPFFLLAVAIALFTQLPASLLDPLLAQASSDRCRLELASGSLWFGQGQLLLRPPQNAAGGGVLALRWALQPARLAGGELAWQLFSGERRLGEVGIGWQGLHLRQIDLQLPVAFALAALPQPLAHLGWGGEFRLRLADGRCSGAGECAGSASLSWLAASSAYFPEGRLGDYELQLTASGRQLAATLQTLAGPVRIAGSGSLAAGQGLAFTGTIDGDSPLLQRLPNVADGIVCPTAAGRQLLIRLPAGGAC